MMIAVVVSVAVIVPLWLGRARPNANRVPATEEPPFFVPEPVPVNPDVGLSRPFRGDVHPVLHGKTSLDVAAHWTEVSQGGRDRIEDRVSPSVYRLFSEMRRDVVLHRVYTERTFSHLLPSTLESIGQVWELDSDAVIDLLSQFHPRPSLELVARGRRAGPDGAFAVLRALSSTHLDILFRIHAEFDIAPNVWFTPACFWGRMIIDKTAGTVEHFHLWVPTEKPLNVHLTVRENIKGVVDNKRDIVRVEQMELESANQKLPETLDWSDSIDMDLAEHKLKNAFYVFENINWVPWQQAREVAGSTSKPILAIVLWGALDDQSC